MANEWNEANVTDTEIESDATDELSQGQTESEETTTAAQSDDLEVRVNHLVEQKVSEKLANLDTEVQRRVQSELQKRKNQADKQLAEDTRAIERMAQRGQVDATRKAELLATANAEAEKAKRVWEVDEEPIAQQYDAPRIVSRTEIAQYLQGEGLSPTDIENISGRYAGLPSNAANAQAALLADVQAAKQRYTPPSREQQVMQQFGNTAPPAGRTGNAAGDPEQELKRLNQQDPSNYPGGVMAYERRMEALEGELTKSGKWKA